MTTTNVDRLVEEIVDIFIARDSHPQVLSAYRARVSKVLTTFVVEAESQARQEGREEALKLALELVEKNDPNVEMGRMTNPHYWGNCLRRELQAALTTEGK